MNIDTLSKQALETARAITETDGRDNHTQEIAFKLACAAVAKEHSKK